MSQESRTTLKGYFNTGDIPTELQYADLIDSAINFTDDASLISSLYSSGSIGEINFSNGSGSWNTLSDYLTSDYKMYFDANGVGGSLFIGDTVSNTNYIDQHFAEGEEYNNTDYLDIYQGNGESDYVNLWLDGTKSYLEMSKGLNSAAFEIDPSLINLVIDVPGIGDYGEDQSLQLSPNGTTINDILTLTPRSTAPSSPTMGTIYVNSNDASIYYHDGNVWFTLNLTTVQPSPS